MMEITTQYLSGLVLLSFLVAIAASFVALDMVQSLSHAKGSSKLFWLTGGSLAMGCGIWSMHFIGMLAFDMPGMTMGYDIQLLILSIVVAVAGSAFALLIMSKNPISHTMLSMSACAMACAIAGMHYIGMFSMRMHAEIKWDLNLIAFSFVIALAASFWAFLVARELTTIKNPLRIQIGASVLLGIGIAGMHYIGMKAAHFYAAETSSFSDGGYVLANSQLTVIVVGVTFMILTLALSGSTIDRILTRRSISEKVNLQKAKEAEIASELKTRFLANMSHEIRTPLGAIIGFTQVLIDEPLSEQQRQAHLKTVLRSARALLALLDDILDLSKIELNKLEIENRDFELKTFLDELMSMFKVKTDAKGLTLDLQVDSLLPKRIFSDSNRLRQILMNLIGNAVKFTEYGGIKVRVKRDGSDYLSFEIEDSGIGLTAEQTSRLFQPFTQADNSTSRVHGGTGLGLDIAKRMAEMLGGTVVILKSEKGKGTTFIATIQLVKARVEEVAKTSLISTFSSGELKTLNILVVDDNEDNQALISLILKSKGATVALASDGSQGVEKAEKTGFDVILMDIQMPVMNGYRAIELLRAKMITSPIIALTANAYKDERDRCFKSGCDAYITKPIDVAELVATIQQLVRV